jgi:hypothetical protein
MESARWRAVDGNFRDSEDMGLLQIGDIDWRAGEMKSS